MQPLAVGPPRGARRAIRAVAARSIRSGAEAADQVQALGIVMPGILAVSGID